MGIHDDDILDFDFVDEVTQESPPPRRGGDPGPGRPPGGPEGPRVPRSAPRAPSGLTPLLRLLGLVGTSIAIVVVLVVWAQGCSTEGKRARYNDYMTQIGEVGRDSAKVGSQLAAVLTTAGLKQPALEERLKALVQQQTLGVVKARSLDPPGPLTPANTHAVEALELRAAGLQGLLDAFRATASTKDSAVAGLQLAAQGQRLSAGDVVWADLFRGQAEQVITAEGISGVTTPASVFVTSSDLFTARQLTLVHERIHGATTGGTTSGIHGSQLVATKVLPAGTILATGVETTIKASTDLGFEVTVKNSGENQEVQLQITLTIPAPPNTIVKKGVIDVIDPGEEKTVVFKDFPEVPFGEETTVQVSVKPVLGETNTANNSAEYPVVFSL